MNYKTVSVLVFIFFSGIIFSFAQDPGDSEVKFANNYIGYYVKGDNSQMYAQMSDRTKTAVNFEGLVDLLKTEKLVLGEVKQYVKARQSETTIDGIKQSVFLYVVDFEKGQGVVTVMVCNEAGKLKVSTFHIDSPAFIKPESKKYLDAFSERQKPSNK